MAHGHPTRNGLTPPRILLALAVVASSYLLRGSAGLVAAGVALVLLAMSEPD